MLALGDVVLRRDAREVDRRGRAGRARRAKEFDLLAYLLEHRGIVLSRDRLLDRVWGMTTPAARARSTCTSRSCGASSAARS